MNQNSICSCLTVSFAPIYSEFGVDIGIDNKDKLWIYEVNVTPGIRSFKELDYLLYRHLLNLRKLAK